jgi:uncharacterized repeat protein (TIGR03803 family)
MHREARFHNSIFGVAWNSALALMIVLLVLLAVVLFIAFTAQPAEGQTYRVIHNFTGGWGGAQPNAGLTIDHAGNLYGTTFYDGDFIYGTVFRLSPSGSSWIFTRLNSFGGSYGAFPQARVIFGPDGTLYGTAREGGSQQGNCEYIGGCGTVFNLRPPATPCAAVFCPWTETVLYSFQGGQDGATPGYGDLMFDIAGKLYGTTMAGGGDPGCDGGCGTVFELSPSPGGWTEKLLFSFNSQQGGVMPASSVVFDQSNNLYGTTVYGGEGLDQSGTVYELTPSGSGWTETVLHAFSASDRTAHPFGGLIFDPSGNLYGTTLRSDDFNMQYCCGGVFEFTPTNNSWVYSLIYSFPLGRGFDGGPKASLYMDANGNLYGTTAGQGAYGRGSVFKLTFLNGSWIQTDLHDFTGAVDGDSPYSTVVFDANGNLYGTASAGGVYNQGVVWEITP